MKVGIISDVHGNLAALERVLEKVKRAGISHLLALGDYVGYHYRPDEVIDVLFGGDYEVTAIRGNHEEMLFEAIASNARRTEIRKKYGSGIDCAIEQCSESQKSILRELPESRQCELGGASFLLSHGAPFDPAQYIYPDSDRTLLDRCAVDEADFVLMGHTHYPFVSIAGDTILINPGSVGQPRDTGCLASFVIVDTEAMSVRNERVEFDIAQLTAEIERRDPELPYLKEFLTRR